MNVFLFGATGFVGKNLIPELLEAGYDVTALVRRSSKHGNLVSDHKVKVVTGDITDSTSYKTHLCSTGYVVNLAGVVTDWAPKSDYYRVHVEGLKKLLDACADAEIKKFVHISTAGVMQRENKNAPLNEMTAVSKSRSPYIRSKSIGETLVLSYAQYFEVVILRPSWIYGTGDKVLLPELARQIKGGKMVIVGGKDIYLPLVHVKNFCDAIILALRKPSVNKEVFIISDGEKTWKELFDQIADSIDAVRPSTVLPYFVAYAVGFVMEVIWKVFRLKGRPLLTRTAAEMLGKTVRLDTSKAEKVLLYRPQIGLDAGIQEVIHYLHDTDI